ncbi:hypothetical protein CC1G_10478 [Coprinopsis cinerea okayama7|uniref:Uncharacterized protein n=1 Tax=Coprinopsis cinerea (strain Okayama-7 / 130 / ATCC MYA-4618 / FGSC 9003) TaxID=240176 RepID=A8NL38_COPC7|nr:hypothetical protein CC1G_10478 [Coprinopsis cinerea okayama7\|eukprot:XP_001834604.2 hypothetical protein CC1G_10478 [Coprinopsis cinerea okayama7\
MRGIKSRRIVVLSYPRNHPPRLAHPELSMKYTESARGDTEWLVPELLPDSLWSLGAIQFGTFRPNVERSLRYNLLK